MNRNRRALLGLLTWLLTSLQPPAVGAERPLDGIAAVVEGKPITRSDIEIAAAPAENQLRGRMDELIESIQERDGGIAPSTRQELDRQFRQQIESIYATALEELVERKLILAEFEKQKLDESIIKGLVDDKLEEVIRERFDNDPLNLTKTLSEQGETIESYRRKLREQQIIEIMTARELSFDFTVSPNKVRNYYESHPDEFTVDQSVKLRAIVISKAVHGPDAGPICEEIVQKIESGVPFAEMAGVYSDDPSRRQDGDWGWIRQQDQVLREDLAALAFSLRKGDRSEITERPDAFYVMQVEDVKGGKLRALSEVRDEIVAYLEAEEQNRRKKIWINRLKDEAYIRYY